MNLPTKQQFRTFLVDRLCDAALDDPTPEEIADFVMQVMEDGNIHLPRGSWAGHRISANGAYGANNC